MASTMVKKVMLKIVADDGDSEEKLDKISAKADELARKHPDIKVRIDSAAASAKLAVLRRELKDTGNAGDKAFSFKGLAPAIGEMSMFQKVMLATNVATTFAEPLVAGLAVAVGGLASAAASAGLGLGAYALVVKEAWKNNKGFQDSIKSAKDEYERWASSLEKPVVAPLERGLKLVMPLLHDMTPFVRTAADAVGQLVTRIGSGLKSSGFTSFLDSMHKIEGPSITGLGTALMHITSGLGGILKAFAPFVPVVIGGLDKITASFARWGQTLSGHSGFQSLISMFKSETPLAVGVLKNLAGIIKTVVADMTGLSGVGNSKSLLEIASPFTALLKVLVQANPQLVRVALYALAAFSGFKKISGAVSGVQQGISTVSKLGEAVSKLSLGSKIAAAATKVWAGVQWVLDAAMDANPIGLIVVAVGLLAAGITLLVIKCKPFREFWIKLWHDAQKIIGDAVDWIKSHWKLLPAIILGPIGIVVTIVITHFNQIRSGAMRLVGDVTSFFRSLPGKIISAIASLPSMLYSAGKNAILGLLHGAESMIGSVLSTVGGWGHDIANAIGGAFGIHFSEPSEATKMVAAGRRVGMGLSIGMDSTRGAVAASAARLGQAGYPSGHGAAGGAGGGEIVLRIEGSDQSLVNALVLALRRDIRIKGGNVQTVLGH